MQALADFERANRAKTDPDIALRLNSNMYFALVRAGTAAERYETVTARHAQQHDIVENRDAQSKGSFYITFS